MRNGRTLQGDFNLLIRFLSIVIALVLLPRLFMDLISFRSSNHRSKNVFNLGIENISDEFLHSILGTKLSRTVGLVTNHASMDQVGNRNIDMFLVRNVRIKKIIAPQHGYFGNVESGAPIGKMVDKKTKIPIISLHDRQIAKSDLAGIDVIFFDLQDVGIRHYSYVQTLLKVMELAAKGKKTIVVFDRPNLLGGCVEGEMTVAANNDFMAIPMRYGMTIGELARYYHKHLYQNNLALHVVPMSNYHRQDVSYLPIIGRLSPNIASLEACQGYSFLGIIGEITPFDIAIGTEKAFKCILLPEKLHFKKQKWYELHAMLDKLGIDSGYYRYYSKRKKDHCSGLQLVVRDVNNFSFVKVLITTLTFFKQAGVRLSYSPYFEKMPGLVRIKELVEGNVKKEEFEKELQRSLKAFFAMASDSFMYYPLPKVLT